MKRQPTAFTLIEIIVALAIVALALVALIRLHLISVNMTGETQAYTHAALLAEVKMNEALARLTPNHATIRGVEHGGRYDFNWQTEIALMNLRQINQNDLAPLRRVNVDVTWKQGNHDRHLELSTYIAH